MENKKEFKKCPRCKSYREEKTYYNKKGRLLKTCSICREREKKNRKKNKCIHNRQKDKCKDCGTGFCIHNRQKTQCKDCGTGYCIHNRQKHTCKDCGTGYCVHNRRKTQCKDCGTGYCIHNRLKTQCKQCHDPLKITIKQWLVSCKRSDKKKKQYDRPNFIDRCFLKNLVEDVKNCIYCKCLLVYDGKRAPNLATIERVNNNKGHVKSNCTLACNKCNSTRGNRYSHEEYKFKFILKELLKNTKLIN